MMTDNDNFHLSLLHNDITTTHFIFALRLDWKPLPDFVTGCAPIPSYTFDSVQTFGDPGNSFGANRFFFNARLCK